MSPSDCGDFTVVETDKYKVLTASQMKLEKAKESLRYIMETYPKSTMAHIEARRALHSLTDES